MTIFPFPLLLVPWFHYHYLSSRQPYLLFPIKIHIVEQKEANHIIPIMRIELT